MEKYYITTPLYYANDEPHIGHTYTTVLADFLSRYHRLLGQEVFFLTGTDEHGQKLQDAAKSENMPIVEFCDLMASRFKGVWKTLNISNDDFIRTTEKRHMDVVKRILQGIYDKGEVYDADYEGWYCVFEERFWTEKDLIDGTCPDCRRPVTKLTEKNYFFKMSKYQDWLIDYIDSHPDFIQPDFRRNEILGFLRQPLGDLCISRPKSRLSWGIELPFDKEYVCYVWFDALINYISAIGYLSDEGRFKMWWPAVHLIGKDILTMHAVYWPCMLKAIGIEQPKTIFAHGWWLSGETKMSKSLGNVIKPLQLAEKYGVDPLRYFLMREMTPGQDASYSESSFIARYNSDLANDLGNLLSRVTKMLESYSSGEIPKPGKAATSDKELEQRANDLLASFNEKIETFKMNLAIEDVMGLVRATNRYLEINKPWELAKMEDNARLRTVLYNSAESLRLVAALLVPVMPERCQMIRKQIGIDADRTALEVRWGVLKPGIKVGRGEALFPRIKREAELEPAQEPASQMAGPKIPFNDFSKVEMRTARVLQVERVEKAEKLLSCKSISETNDVRLWRVLHSNTSRKTWSAKLSSW